MATQGWVISIKNVFPILCPYFSLFFPATSYTNPDIAIFSFKQMHHTLLKKNVTFYTISFFFTSFVEAEAFLSCDLFKFSVHSHAIVAKKKFQQDKTT